MKEVETLLGRVASINRAHDTTAHVHQHGFNVFSILRQEDDEVNLHSRFLAELLNPQGSHARGTRLLELFLERVGITGFDVDNAQVIREYKGIDIFVRSGTHAIIIENKIYAPDQYRQLERYHRTVTREGFEQVSIFYLSLYGDDPSAESVGALKREWISSISYKDDIHGWLDECVVHASPYPALKETLVQYQRLIEKLTGQHLGKKYIMDIKALLMDEKNLALATSVSQALVEARIDVQFNFWQELEAALVAEGFDILDNSKYSKSKVEDYHRKGRRSFGLSFILRELDERDQLAFRVEVFNRVYYNFPILRNGKHARIAEDSRFDELAAVVSSLDENWQRTEWSIGWRPPERRLDFAAFNDPNVFALVDPSKRERYIGELIDEISDILERFQQGIKGKGL